MKPQEKLSLIEEISEALSHLNSDKVEFILNQYGYFPYEYRGSYKSSRDMAYETLKGFNESDLFRIAEDQDIEVNSVPSPPSPNIWKPNFIKLFLSHSTKDKSNAIKLKLTLEKWGIDLFVAHQDISVSEEWRKEILKALGSMDAFAAFLTENFKESEWTDQEFGFAFAKNTVVIPLIYDIVPYGFMGSTQGTRIIGETPYNVAISISRILVRRIKTREKMIGSLFNLVVASQELGEFAENLNQIGALKKEIGLEYFLILRDQILDNTFFNKPSWITEFNSFIKKNFNNEIEFISKKIFNERHSNNIDDDRLPF